MSCTYKIFITIKRGILDNAGNAVTNALETLGFPEVSNVRIGKILEIELASKDDQLADEIAKSQTNEVMENYTVMQIQSTSKGSH